MKRSNIRALTSLVAAMLVIAQIAGAQTQSSTPQPSQNSNSNGKIVRPEPQPPRQQQQKQTQQQQETQKQQQQPPPQSQQQNQPEPQQQQQEQLQPPQQGQQQRQRQARRVRRSKPNPVPASVMSYSSALQRCQRERHNRNWWSQHFAVIVLVGGGYYYFDSGYWFPALGFDPNYEAYDYDHHSDSLAARADLAETRKGERLRRVNSLRSADRGEDVRPKSEVRGGDIRES